MTNGSFIKRVCEIILTLSEKTEDLFAQCVLKTLYSPIKAFEEIVKKPDVKGPLLILVLILVLTTGSQYASASRIFDEEPMINRDEWTESIAWAPHWASNGEEIKRDTDKVVGNYSVTSSITNNTYIWMNLTEIGAVNCSRKSGYERLSFWIKWKSQNQTFIPPNATLRLFSNNGNGYFMLDFNHELSNSSDEWNNIKIDLGPESENYEDWKHVGAPNWEKVTGIQFALAWAVPENLTMRIDDLYFAKFLPIARYFFSGLYGSLTMSAINFLISWGVYGIIIFLVIKMFGEKVEFGKKLFLVVGYLFSVRIVHILVAVALIPTLPEIRLENLAQIWYSTLSYQAIGYFSLVTDVWMALLCAIAVRSLCTLKWGKAISISVLASVINFILISFMTI